MSTGRGFKFLREQREELANKIGNRSSSRIFKLWLKEDEVAQFYFVTDIDDIAAPLVHIVDKVSKNNKNYWADVQCSRESLQSSPLECDLCQAGVRGPWPRAVALIWVDYILHKKNKEEGSDWEIRKAGNGHVYIEHVKALRLLVMKDKLIDQLETYIEYGQDPASPEEQTTILDRPFKFQSTGSGTSKTEVLTAGNPPPAIPSEVLEARSTAPDLDELVASEFSDGSTKKSPTVASGMRSRFVSEDTVDYDDDDDSSDLDIDFD